MTAQRPDQTRQRHGVMVRAWHWLNAVALAVMLMSGLAIFNAHPRLYWGQTGTWGDPAWLQIGSSGDKGLLLVGERMFDTSGWLGLWTDSEGRTQQWAMPGWATLPARYDLALARNWHLLFAWVMVLAWLVYVLHGWWRGHFRGDLGVRSDQLRPRALWLALQAHFGLTALRALATGEYNSLQRLSYLAVIFGLIPLMILTGLSMSPGVNAALPWLPELFGGRQSARSLHFLTMTGLLLFVVLHLVMVLLAGPFRLTRSMITGGVQGDG